MSHNLHDFIINLIMRFSLFKKPAPARNANVYIQDVLNKRSFAARVWFRRMQNLIRYAEFHHMKPVGSSEDGWRGHSILISKDFKDLTECLNSLPLLTQ